MRRRGLAILVSVLALAASLSAFPAEAHARVSISFFYSELSPYGEWVSLAGYGPCWRPLDVPVGWQPYLDGEWVYTDEGWTWVSYDPWGGDPYHYGTWVDDVEFGWCWIPGTIWAPAWVTWYIADDYCGWAPVPPTFSVSASGYAGRAVTVAPSAYVFVPTSRLVGGNVRNVRVAPSRNTTLVREATPLTRFPVSGGVVTTAGPSISHVSRVSGRTIRRVSVSSAKTAPVPIAASVPRSTRMRVTAPVQERQRVIGAGAPARASAPARGAIARAPAPRVVRSETPPRRVAPPPRVEAPPARVARSAPPPRVERAEPRRVERAAPPARLPAAGRVAAPPQRVAPGPPPGAASPQARAHGAPPPRAHPAPQGNGRKHQD